MLEEIVKKKKIPWNKGKKLSEECRKKMSLASLGKSKSLQHRKNISLGQIGKKCPWVSERNKIDNPNPNWIADRTQLSIDSVNGERRSAKYSAWRREICNRDNWKCKINNSDCNGRLEVHHILSFRDFIELRYEINNGITLCHFHHPRKRIDEINLSPYFQSLVMNVK